MLVNERILQRYYKFIDNIKRLGNRDIAYTERHHIVPKCMGGSNELENLIDLTLREHYLAHMMLAKAYPDNVSINSAFIMMGQRQTKSNMRARPEILSHYNSRLYESLKTNFYQNIAPKIHLGKVRVKNNEGEVITLSRDEYQDLKDEFPFHTKGMVWVHDIASKSNVYITSDVYQNDKNRYSYAMLRGHAQYEFYDRLTLSNVWISNEEWEAKKFETIKEKFKNIRRYKRLQLDVDRAKKDKFPVRDLHGNMIRVTKEEFDPNKHKTTTKGKSLMRCKTTGQVTALQKDEMRDNYQGITKGYSKVYDTLLSKVVLIPQEDFKANKDRYHGHLKGLVNCINKETGEKHKLPKTEFDKEKYCSLGSPKLLVKCRNLLTNKIKKCYNL